MSALATVGIVIGALLALFLLSVVVALAIGRGIGQTRGAISVVEAEGGRLTIRTPYGPGSARLVVHDDLGKVYEIALSLRGEPKSTLTYVPPAIAMVRSHVATRVDAIDMKRHPLNPPQEPTP